LSAAYFQERPRRNAVAEDIHLTRRRWLEPLSRHEIVAVDAGSGDANDDLTRARFRIGELFDV
jgi:hypothetical protein